MQAGGIEFRQPLFRKLLFGNRLDHHLRQRLRLRLDSIRPLIPPPRLVTDEPSGRQELGEARL